MAKNIGGHFFNRELSWLEFNSRVLEQALDTSVPLLERIKFLCITATNLDEFFMVRVGGLLSLAHRQNIKPDFSGRTPLQQLEEIYSRVRSMVERQYACFSDILEPSLSRAGIIRTHPSRLTDQQNKYMEHLFRTEIMPILTPIAVQDDLPLLANRVVHILVCLKIEKSSDDQASRYVIIPLPRTLDRLVTLPAEKGYQFVLLDDLVSHFVDLFFPDESAKETVSFRITRNADMSVREDLAYDLLVRMESVLDERTRSDCVRLETGSTCSTQLRNVLEQKVCNNACTTFSIPGPVDLSTFLPLSALNGFDDYKYAPWPARPSVQIKKGQSIFDAIRASDILLYHPYESFEPVLQFIEEAANDPDVVAIKQILYRTSRNSPIITALRRAADNGKYVTALVELKARFDEERNIEWARELENSGVQVIYGLKGLKTHAKICIVLRREPQGLQRYLHFGTGNYNETTARLYSDISYLTFDENYGADASAFFNTITGYSQPCQFGKLEAAPIGLRKKLIALIEAETERSRQGHKASIMAKMNSLADARIMKALYSASKAGVKIRLNIRGICCLRPGIKGLSDTIRVTSIVDRYLEHARIFYFYNGGDELVFISSADWMPRNLDRRVELLVPIEDKESRQRLIQILETHFSDTVNAWLCKSDGRYERITAGVKKKPLRSQEQLYLQACDTVEQSRQQERIVFEPLKPPSER